MALQPEPVTPGGLPRHRIRISSDGPGPGVEVLAIDGRPLEGVCELATVELKPGEPPRLYLQLATAVDIELDDGEVILRVTESGAEVIMPEAPEPEEADGTES